jgi:uncharacterized damage-inducible protein DinB
MTFEYLKSVLDYHYWARDRVLDAVSALSQEQYEKQMGSSFSSIQETLVHTFSAEWVWFRRWNGESPMSARGRVEIPDVATLRQEWSALEGDVRRFLDGLGPDGIHRQFDYTTFNGKSGRSAFWEMLAHVINHGTYHRGQVATMLRQLGETPAKPTDMIAFFRERGQGTPSAAGR